MKTESYTDVGRDVGREGGWWRVVGSQQTATNGNDAKRIF